MSDHDVHRMDEFMERTKDIPCEYCVACGRVQPLVEKRCVDVTILYCGVCHRWLGCEYEEQPPEEA